MKIMGTQMPEQSSHIRAVELMTEYMKLSQQQREKNNEQFIEAVVTQTMPVEVLFKAAIMKLKI